MDKFGHKAIDWLVRRLAGGARERGDGEGCGIEAALDGMTAVVASESSWCRFAGLGGTGAAERGSRLWSQLAEAGRCDVWGSVIGGIEAGTGAGALSAAIGSAMTGVRTTAFLSGHDLFSVGAMLEYAAGRRVAMVAHVAMGAEMGHGSLMCVADCGWGQLVAISAQESVDLSLVARIASERSLVPFMVGSDASETAMSVQDARLPAAPMVRDLLGKAERRVDSTTPAQRVLFGESRGAVPRWHDLDDASMMTPVESLGVAGAAAGRAFFGDHVEEALGFAYGRVSGASGRALGALALHRMRDARAVLVTVGSVTEVACAAADVVRERDGLRVGVVGVRQLRPWAGDALGEALGSATRVVVLERSDSALGGDGALTRQVRACCGDGIEVCRCVYGVGGASVGVGEVVEVCREMERSPRALVYLGTEFVPEEGVTVKRQSTIDGLRRSYPGLAGLGIRGSEDVEGGRGREVVRVSVVRGTGREDGALSRDAAGLVHGMVGGRLRGLWGSSGARGHGVLCADRIESGVGAVAPGTGGMSDVVVVSDVGAVAGGRVVGLVRDGGVLIVARGAEAATAGALDAAEVRDGVARGVRVFVVPFEAGRAYEIPEPAWRRHEALLGALAGAIGTMEGREGVAGKACRVREGLLEQEGASPDPSVDGATRLAAFENALGRWEELGWDVFSSGGEAVREGPSELIQRLGRSDHPVRDLPGFWDRHRGGEAIADPFASVSMVPALSSGLRAVADEAGELVEFDPATCDGFGGVWTSCPDGSVGAVALSAAELLRAGMRLAAEAGVNTDALTPVVSKLGARVNKMALEGKCPPTSVRTACEPAFEWLVGKMSLSEDRRAALVGAFGGVMDAIGVMPLARTMPFFDEPERDAAGTGEFLIVGTDPDACKNAKLAVGVCEGRGLRIVQRDAISLERARRLWQIFERLPDTQGTTIERVREHAGVGALAAMMLSKRCASVMAPGDASEAGEGARMALRIVLGACEAEVGSRVERLVGEIRTLQDGLSEKVHETLARSLPDADLDALSAGLRSLGREDVDLAGLSASVNERVEGGRIDAARLARLIEPARALADVEWRLREGVSGLGRARVGIAIAPGDSTLWAIGSALNPFSVPVTIEGAGWAPDLARGLCAGQMGASLEVIRILRWARGALDRPDGVGDVGGRGVPAWSDLSDQERSVCPPLLLVGDEEILGAGDYGALLGLASSDLPIKVVAFAGAGMDSGAVGEGVLAPMLSRRAYVARCSIGAGDHLAESARRAVAFDGPALLHIHAPSARRHVFPAERLLWQAWLCVRSRAHCLLRFDPGVGGAFGACLDLSGNPEPGSVLARDEAGCEVTPLDWAITEGRFEHQLRSVAGGEDVVPIARLLGMAPEERRGTVGMVVDPLDRSEWIASARLVEYGEERLRVWRMLREMAGVTPFEGRVREEAAREVMASHEAEVSVLRREHELALAELRGGLEAQAVERVRDGLMRLVGYGEVEEAAAMDGVE